MGRNKHPLKLGKETEAVKISLHEAVSKKRGVTSFRPGVSVSQYVPSYCNALIKHVALGKSLTEFCYKIGVTVKTFENWIDKYPEFAVAVEMAIMGEQVWWENAAQMQAIGEIKGSATIMWNMLTSKFPDHFANKQEVNHNTNVVFHIDTGIKRPGDVDFVEIDDADFREIPAALPDAKKKSSDLL